MCNLLWRVLLQKVYWGLLCKIKDFISVFHFTTENPIFVVESCSLYFVQNEAEERGSFISKLLPVKKITLVMCLFSAGKNYWYGTDIHR